MKTGILCHGRHVLANNWELHEWGDPEKGLLGQVPKTLLLTATMMPEKVVFGTGASQKDGMKESEYTVKYMMDNFNRLKDFPQFEGVSLGLLQDYIQRHLIKETNSQNTAQEIEYAAKIFDQNEIGRTIIVSNPDHISRCMQLAHQVYHTQHLKSLTDVFGAQSDVGYNGTNGITSKIIEKPHRGDDPSPDLASIIGKYFSLPKEAKEEYFRLSDNFFNQYKK